MSGKNPEETEYRGAGLLVHAGWFRTGSSWLQRHLFERTDRGFYPLAPRDSDDGRRACMRLGRLLYKRHGSYLAPLAFDAAAWRAENLSNLAWRDDGVPVVSNERLSGNPHSGGFDALELAQRLRAVLPEARVFLVVRQQAAMILSAYYQFLEKGGARSLESYVGEEYDGRAPGFSLDYLEYHRLVAHYQELFGKDRVLVLPYEMFRDAPQDFVTRLSEFAGARIPGDLPFGERVNPSPAHQVLRRTRLLNLLSHSTSLNAHSPVALPGLRRPVEGLRTLLGRFLPDSGEERLRDTETRWVRERVAGRYAESNRTTSSLVGIDLGRFGYE